VWWDVHCWWQKKAKGGEFEDVNKRAQTQVREENHSHFPLGVV
jgi:hypothetical protein